MHFTKLDTPCVLIDLDKVDRNLQCAQDYANTHGLKLRPHIKTHKLPRFAQWQIDLGAIGITCQKVGEADVMAGAGLKDILIPYNILGAEKLARLKALSAHAKFTLSADSLTTIDGYAATFTDSAHPMDVVVECDTGMGRCGVPTPEATLPLARTIASHPGLAFAGLMTYPAAGGYAAALRWLTEAKAILTQAGLPPRIISSGGTPDLYHAHESASLITDYRPGTYIYSDRFQVTKGIGTLEDCALTVLTTVVSRPTDTRVVIDAGSKALTSDTLGLNGFGHVIGFPEAVVVSLSEEHGVIDMSACPHRPQVGETLRIIPNHACVVSNLFNTIHLIQDETLIETTPVAARGCVG